MKNKPTQSSEFVRKQLEPLVKQIRATKVHWTGSPKKLKRWWQKKKFLSVWVP